MTRFPPRSRWKPVRGGMTVVALYSVMIAGPEYLWPGWRSSREWIFASSFLPSNRTGALGGEGLPSFARLGSLGFARDRLTGAAVPSRVVVVRREARRRRVTSS